MLMNLIKNTLYITLTVILYLTVGCGSKEPAKETPTDQTQSEKRVNLDDTTVALEKFDVKSYFEGEIKRLSYQNPMVTKTVFGQGPQETKQLKINSWHKELSIFLESDINKPAWRNAYSCDTVRTEKDLIIAYAAREENLNIRSLSVRMDAESKVVKEINIQQFTTNNLYTSTRVLTYVPGESYSVLGDQKVKMVRQSSYGIMVKF